MAFVKTAPLLNEELYDMFLTLDDIESQKEWMQATQHIEDQLEEKYSITRYQKVEQHWMTIFFVLNYLVDLLPFQHQGELVGSLLTRHSTKQNHWLLNLWTSHNWRSAVADPMIKPLDNTTTFISLIWQGQIIAKYLGTDRSILSLALESATCFHDYTYQLQSSSLDMSVVTCPSTITTWSEFLLLDAVNYFPQLKHCSGNTLLNILPSSAQLVNRYLSDVPEYVCNRCDNRPLLLRCSGCKSCEAGGVNNCSGFTLPSGDKFECGNFCRVILITNKDHYRNCRAYIIRRWGPPDQQACSCGECVQCLDREVNGPGNEFEQWGEANWYKKEDLTSPTYTEKDKEFTRADENRKRERKNEYKENCTKRHREHET